MKNYIKKFLFNILTPLLLGITVHSQGVYTTNGSSIVMNGDVKLVLHNAGISLAGTITSNSGSLHFTGNTATANSFLSGTTTISLNNLVLNKSANGLLLNQNLNINGNLEFISGDSLFLNGQIINLGSTGTIIGETGSMRITGETGGYVQATAILNAPAWVNPGNIGLSITSSANLGSTTIKRYPQPQGGISIKRFYDVTPSNNSALNASLRFYYFHEELNSNLEANVGLFWSNDAGTTWTNFSYDAVDYNANYIEKAGISTLYRFTLSDLSAALATRLQNFKGKLQDRTVMLNWETGGETESLKYVIERSKDAFQFETIGTVPGKGSIKNLYNFSDLNPVTGTSYYRIRFSENNREQYSSVIKIDNTLLSIDATGWLPNPAHTQVLLRVKSNVDTKTILKLISANGRIVLAKTIQLQTGINNITIDVSTLPPGLYFLNQKDLYQQSGWLYIQK